MLNYEKIAATITALREVHNLSQRAFAESIELVSKHYIIAIEKMRVKDINPIFMEKIRDKYGIDLSSDEYKIRPFEEIDSDLVRLAKQCSTQLDSVTKQYLTNMMVELLDSDSYIEAS